jgi:hypothetical protein
LTRDWRPTHVEQITLEPNYKTVSSFKNLSTGEKVGNFTVGNIVLKGTPDNLGYTISSTGTTTIRGNFYEDPYLTTMCFEPDTSDLEKIPRVTDQPYFNFCFSNPERVLDYATASPNDIFTIEIADYVINYAPKEITDTAKFIKVIK